MDLSTLPTEQLQEMTKDELLSAILGDRTESKCITSEGDKRGQLRQAWETFDWQGNLLSTREFTWTYYPEGNVDTITSVDKDNKGKENKRQVVKHNKSGGLAEENTIKEGKW